MRQPQPGSNCLNCGQDVSNHRYCPDCGQLNDTHRLTFSELVADTFGNLFALDAKFFSTLWPLLRYPGQVALRYVNGQKTRFVPPVRMYLLSTFILLFAFSLYNLLEEEEPFVITTNAPASSAAADSTDELTLNFGDSDSSDFMVRVQNHIKTHPEHNEIQGLAALAYEPTFWNRFLYKQVYKIHHLDGEEFWNYFKNHLLIILFAFVPFFAFLLSLFYLRRNAYYFDHLVFILYTQSVLFLAIAFAQLAVVFGLPEVFSPFMLAFAVYLLFALKCFYKQGWGKTILKFLIINASYLVLAIVFLVLSTMVTFLIY